MRTHRGILAALSLLLLLTACGRTFSAGAAVVNGVKISRETVDARVEEKLAAAPAPPGAEGRIEAAREVLLELIRAELLRQEAGRLGARVEPQAVESQYAEIRAQFPDEASFQDRLKQFGLNEATLRERIREELLTRRLREKVSPKVEDAEVRRFYAQNRAEFRQVRVRHILFQVGPESPEGAALREANQVLTRARAGEDFAELAQRYSDDPGSKDQGGLLDWTLIGQLDPAFARAAQEARIGRVVGPVRSQFGFHLIVTLGKRVQPLAQAAPGIREQLGQQRSDRAFETLLQGVIRRARVVVNPRYGDWDPASGTIVPHRSFVPASPEADPGGGPVPEPTASPTSAP